MSVYFLAAVLFILFTTLSVIPVIGDKQKLETNKLKEKVNVIHLSDHGMIDVKPPNFINITQFLTPNTYRYSGSSPILQVYPKNGYEVDVYQRLKDASKQIDHFKVYKKDEYLERWHYKNNQRTPLLIVMADVGYALEDELQMIKKYSNKYNLNVTNESTFGVHGYDYIEKEMRPFFMARGQKFKVNHKVPPFRSIDLFNLFCKVLQIETLDNNGTLANINDMLATRSGNYSFKTILTITAVGIIAIFILIGCAATFTLLMIKRQQRITTAAALNKRFPQTFQTSIEAQHLLESEDT